MKRILLLIAATWCVAASAQTQLLAPRGQIVTNYAKKTYTDSLYEGLYNYLRQRMNHVGKLPADSITQDDDHQFVTKEEKDLWTMLTGMRDFVNKFWVTDYGANGADTLDDGVAIIAANEAWKAAGKDGKVMFPNGHYYIKSPLLHNVDSVDINAQLYFPLVRKGKHMLTLIWEGETAPNMTTEGIDSTARNESGVILESTLRVGAENGFVVSTPYYNPDGVTGLRNYGNFWMKNMIIRTNTMSGSAHVAGTMSGIDMRRGLRFGVEFVKVDIKSPAIRSVYPSYLTVGIYFPDVSSQSSDAVGLFVEGYAFGAWIYEHFNAPRKATFLACRWALNVGHGYHANSMMHLNVENCGTSINMDGQASLSIQLYDTEHNGGFWYFFRYDIERQAGGDGEINITMCVITKDGARYVEDFHTVGNPYYRVHSGQGRNVHYLEDLVVPTPISALPFLGRMNTLGEPVTTADSGFLFWLADTLTGAGFNTVNLKVLNLHYGSSAASQAVNFIDTNTYPYIFVGGNTYNRPGFKGSGSDGYANTQFTASSSGYGVNNIGFTFELADSILSGPVIFGCFSGGNPDGFQAALRVNSTQSTFAIADLTNYLTVTNPIRFDIPITAQRSSPTNMSVYYDKVLAGTSTIANSANLPNVPFLLGARKASSTVADFNTATYRFFAAHEAMSATRIAQFHYIMKTASAGIHH